MGTGAPKEENPFITATPVTGLTVACSYFRPEGCSLHTWIAQGSTAGAINTHQNDFQVDLGNRYHNCTRNLEHVWHHK